MTRLIVAVALLIGAPAVPVLPAQAAVAAQNPQQCTDTTEKQRKRSMFGSILGGVASGVLGSVGGTAATVAIVTLPAASYLGEELLRVLDCKEQQQAAKATDDAIRGGVGTEVAWKSESRAGVHGASKVTGQQQLADGSQCLTVTDVVIVDGEETTVPKTMCKAPGKSGFVKV